MAGRPIGGDSTPPVDLNTTRDIVTDYMAWECHVNTGASTLEALRLEERYGLAFWDALTLQAADASGVSIVYSEDLSDGQTYGSVRVVNPLK